MATITGYHPSTFQNGLLNTFNAVVLGFYCVVPLLKPAGNLMDRRLAVMILVCAVGGVAMTAVYLYNLFYVLVATGANAVLTSGDTIPVLTAGLMWRPSHRAIPIINAILACLTFALHVVDMGVAGYTLANPARSTKL